MDRLKRLNRYHKALMMFMTVMAVAFAVIYPLVISRVGFEYRNSILVPCEENGSVMYSGRVNGQPACFTVSSADTVTFACGDRSYGPYTVREEPTAVPKGEELSEHMKGVEIYKGEEVIFRGGFSKINDAYLLYNEDGSLHGFGITYVTGDGIERDENGDIIDPVEPDATTVIKLTEGPELTHKGEGIVWLASLLICVLNAGFILFADELFAWHMSFRIRNADTAEPSEWEIAGRYVSQTVMVVAALAVFVMGLL